MRFIRQQQSRAGIGKHRGEQVHRIRRIKRQINFVRLECAEDRCHQQCVVLHEQPDRFGGFAETVQDFNADSARVLVELSVSPFCAGRDDGSAVGKTRDDVGKSARD